MTFPMNRASEWVTPSLQPAVLGILTLISLGVFLAGIWPKFRVLLRAAPDPRFDRPAKRLMNTLSIAFAQSKLFKNPAPGLMHAAIFWGFMVLLARAAQFFFIGFFPSAAFSFPGEAVWRGYSLFKDFTVLAVTLAVLYGLYRRLIVRPPRLNLSFQGNLILVLILVIMVTDVLFEGAFVAAHPQSGSPWEPLGTVAGRLFLAPLDPGVVANLHDFAYWGHVTAILFFLTLLPHSKHFHIITSIPNVFLSNVAGKGNLLRRIDFEAEGRESFGATRIEEFSWKALLDLHTCTECGRCDLFCPALKSGKPLSPKQLTLDLRDHLNRSTPRLLSPEPGAPGGDVPLLGGVIQDETVWSCTTCGACEEECPVMIEYVNKVVDLRRGLVLSESRYPAELKAAFKSLETNSNPWGFGRDSRADWARGLDVKLWDKDKPTEYLYFVGCNGAFDARGKKIAASVVSLLKSANVDFSILGVDEGCTGDPARRAGNEYLFDLLASQNAETFKERGVKKVIVHCPHCFNSLKNEYPEFGVNLEVVHHSELLEKLLQEGRLKTSPESDMRTVYHDSCYLGRHNKIYDAPRAVLSAKTAAPLEPENRRERGTCCGAGGARFLLEEKTGTRMSHQRVDELMATNPKTIAVSCPFCVLMLEDGLKAKNLADQVKVLDISEILGANPP
ncbi:MAG: 4Fe-4S dicluster domain-containing protein [Nitrospinae bacterium]|nr:4Fe-4S dicluster domain-containing protein [Nitrospinota bacterium]